MKKTSKFPMMSPSIGFDDIMLTGLFKPKLTIVNQPLNLIAEAVVNSLLDRMKAPKIKEKSQQLMPTYNWESVKTI